MLLPFLIIIPFIGGIISWISENFNKKYPKKIALIFTLIVSIILFVNWFIAMHNKQEIKYLITKKWIQEFDISWINYFGIDIHLGIDYLSYMMIFLTIILGMVSILCSWDEIEKKQGFFYFNIMSIISFTIGIFLSIDLFLFFCFWELIIVPTYFIISIWGLVSKNENQPSNSANKFIVISQISSLIMLLAILGLVINFYEKSHIWSFDYNILLKVPLNFNLEYLLMLGFFIAFAIKIPIVPFHIWLPDIHAYSPTAGSIDLSGFLLKTGVYGLLRFCIPMSPNVFNNFINIAFFLGLITIFYPAILAFSETNIKKIFAYTSVSHMGMILIGIYANNKLTYQGIIFQLLSNGLSMAGLFVLSGQIYKRLNTYNLCKMQGLYCHLKWVPGFLLFFIMANIGIPGTGNFIGEFLILLGTFKKYPIIALLSSLGLIFSTVYLINIIRYTNYGNCIIKNKLEHILIREFFIIMFLIFSVILLGIYPTIIFH